MTGRNGASGGTNHRITCLENNATVFDAIGTYLTGTYNNSAVRAPDGTPGRTGATLRINDPGFCPYTNNASGPGMNRRQSLSNYTLTADWQPTKNLFINVGHNYQKTDVLINLMVGASPVLRGEPNRTLGLGGPANPFVGRLYFDGDWRRDVHFRDYRETRLPLSDTLDTKSKWLGSHRIVGLVSRSEDYDARANSWLVQSHFLRDRLVTTLGYRQDKARITELGYRDDPIRGDVVDPDPAKHTINNFTGKTHTVGVVLHVFDWVSLTANRSSNVGIGSVCDRARRERPAVLPEPVGHAPQNLNAGRVRIADRFQLVRL